MKQYILGIDQGTSSSRAFLFDEELNCLSQAQQEVPLIYPKNDWVEQDAELIYLSVCETIEQCLESAGISAQEVSAIGITNQRETSIVWERSSSRALHNAISWQSKQTQKICDGLADLEVKSKTGLLVDCYFSAPKIRWVLDHCDAQEQAETGELCFGTIDTWLIWKLTGGNSHVTDLTNASRTMAFNIHKLHWDAEILTRLDLPPKLFPKVLSSRDKFGFACEGPFKNMSVPILAVAGDQQAALYGQGCDQPGMVKNTYGTGCFMLMHTGEKAVQSESGLLTTLACSSLEKPQYALEGSVFIAGAAIQWLRDNLQIIDEAKASGELAEELKGNGGVVFVPSFSGLGTPYWKSHVKGGCFGLTRATDKRHIARAALEAIAFQSKDLLEVMKQDCGSEIHSLRVDGGACASDFLMQFQADLLGVSLNLPDFTESSVLGAARLALEALTGREFSMESRAEKSFTAHACPLQMKELYSQWQKALDAVITFSE
ncbi:glycerol kinase GlpK [Lentisphaera profundi]|uniref:ATP:glycerol 3-phosphotransferase n=1 Tax=Lentisphaera profundi TaxID=1658616 RepID=A0ABY7VS83_9BACT|nr:glycerol kinase GlpK [Lentisphaera profundi]WDE96164.1 glycerol kinase GlpK [Lentisphaera profundi]